MARKRQPKDREGHSTQYPTVKYIERECRRCPERFKFFIYSSRPSKLRDEFNPVICPACAAAQADKELAAGYMEWTHKEVEAVLRERDG